MLGVFLTGDFLQAGRVIKNTPFGTSFVYACLAGIEVLATFVAAYFAVSYKLLAQSACLCWDSTRQFQAIHEFLLSATSLGSHWRDNGPFV